MPEVPLPLREACGPRIALRHRLLPVSITGEGDHKRLKICTFDPFNLVARQAAARLHSFRDPGVAALVG